MAGEIFYPPPQVIFRQVQIAPFVPLPNDNPPFSITRRIALEAIRASWDVPYLRAISNQSLGRFYQAQWDIPDTPPFSPQYIQRQLQLVLANYINTNILQYPKRANVAPLVPRVDNPPPFILPKQLERILLATYEYFRYMASFTVPNPVLHRAPSLFGVGAQIIDLGSIAFQPNAFFVGYPRRRMGFQGANRIVDLSMVSAKPFIRVVLSVRRRPMDIHKPGDAIVIEYQTFDPAIFPEPLFTPESVTLTIYKPDGTIKIDSIPMVVRSQGSSIYIHQSSTNDVEGVYTTQAIASHHGHQGLSIKQAAFKLVKD